MALFKTSIYKKAGSYLIELIIVIVGVSIAFQLSVWNETRRSNEIENHLLQSFVNENQLNQAEIDSTVLSMEYTLKANPELIEMLKDDMADIDSIRSIMATLYSISWPDITSTHLNNYLEFESAISPLKEEMLVLKTHYNSIDELLNVYIDQKQQKYFDYLSDVVDMTDGLKLLNEEKLRDIQFRNNLLIIYFYETSLMNTYGKIQLSQKKIMEFIDG
jgi:competence protein ComGC